MGQDIRIVRIELLDITFRVFHLLRIEHDVSVATIALTDSLFNIAQNHTLVTGSGLCWRATRPGIARWQLIYTDEDRGEAHSLLPVLLLQLLLLFPTHIG